MEIHNFLSGKSWDIEYLISRELEGYRTILESMKKTPEIIENQIPFLSKTIKNLTEIFYVSAEELEESSYQLFEDFSVTILNYFDENPSKIKSKESTFLLKNIVEGTFIDICEEKISRNLRNKIEDFLTKHNNEYQY